jgi:uncharacterized protein (UPF0262 family)
MIAVKALKCFEIQRRLSQNETCEESLAPFRRIVNPIYVILEMILSAMLGSQAHFPPEPFSSPTRERIIRPQ